MVLLKQAGTSFLVDLSWLGRWVIGLVTAVAESLRPPFQKEWSTCM